RAKAAFLRVREAEARNGAVESPDIGNDLMGIRMGFFSDPVLMLWKYRSLLRQTTWSDISARFAGSVLGLLWLVAYPLVFLGTYALVFIVILKAKIPGQFEPTEYAVMIFCGLVPFIGFIEALNLGVVSVTSNANLIKNTLFPIELIPVKTVLSSQCTQVVGTVMLLIAVVAIDRLTWWALMLPAVWILQIMFSLGLIWILSSLNVIMRDLQAIMGVVTLLLMIGSPIYWTAEMVPEKMRPWMGLNPLYHMILSYRGILMMGRWPMYGVFWKLLILAFVTFFVGYWFFSRMKKVFVDNV
ncbi:MAG: ABC transporter permease, partial [Planctomycetota bacterium]|nr:ABC transporter permease [Planctomycetota bacterium]